MHVVCKLLWVKDVVSNIDLLRMSEDAHLE